MSPLAVGVLQGDGDDVGPVIVTRPGVSPLDEGADSHGDVLAVSGGPGLGELLTAVTLSASATEVGIVNAARWVP